METLFFKGKQVHTSGTMPKVGEKAPCFTLVDKDLKEIRCIDYKGKTIVLNIFPSLDTDVCAASVRRFNLEASKLDNTVVICVSMDLPFAERRFCEINAINNVIIASAFRSPLFRQKYGLLMVDGLLAGLLARCVIIINPEREIVYRELVENIEQEPNYSEAMEALRQLNRT